MWCKRRVLVCSALVWCLALVVVDAGQAHAQQPVPEQELVGGVKPLSAQALKALWSSPEDPKPAQLGGPYAGTSYLSGNEWNMHLFYPKIKGVGGGYMGVGSDQAYLLMGWSRPEIAWLTDYDPLVQQIHRVHFAFFKEAKTPEAFLRLWSKEGQADALSVLERDYKDDPKLPLLRKIYGKWRPAIARRHSRLKKDLKERGIPSFMSEQSSYDHVRGLIQAGRVRPMLGNLLESQGLIGAGKVARELGVPIRVLYLSNAEEYWEYTPQFRQNIQGLPFDESSYTLHTLSVWTVTKDYRYAIQPSLKYVEWLKRDWVKKVHTMIPRRKLSGPDDLDFMEFELDVAQVEAARKARRSSKPGKVAKKEL